MAIIRYCHFQFCIKGGAGFQDGISFWLNGKRGGKSTKKSNKITFPDQYFWSHFLKVGKKKRKKKTEPTSSKGYLQQVWKPGWEQLHCHGSIHAASFPLRAPRLALPAGLQVHGPHAAAPVRMCGLSREEALCSSSSWTWSPPLWIGIWTGYW